MSKLKRTHTQPLQYFLEDKPEWMTEEAVITLMRGYLLSDETPNQMYERISRAAASYYPNGLGGVTQDQIESWFCLAFKKGWLSPATPVASNLGAGTKSQAVSCFSVYADNSIRGIFDSVKETALLTKAGGGVSVSLTGIEGPTSVTQWAKFVDLVGSVVSQGCYDDKTEILTDEGWVFFKDLPKKEYRVAQVGEDKEITFVKYSDYIEYEVDEELLSFKNKSGTIDLLVTKNHNMVVEREVYESYEKDSEGNMLSHKRKFTNKLELIEAENTYTHRHIHIPLPSGIKAEEENSLSWEERLLIAYQADGSTNPGGNSLSSYVFHFSKERKIARLINILENLEWKYKTYETKDNTKEIHVTFPYKPSKSLKDSFNLGSLSKNKAREILEEVREWDGTQTEEKGSMTYYSTSEENCDFVQSVSCLAGWKSLKRSKTNREGNRKDLYTVHLVPDSPRIGLRDVKKERVHYKGKVYCVTVPSHKLVVRRSGSPLVCGNSRRGAVAVYMNARQDGIEEFLNSKELLSGDVREKLDCNIGVLLDDEFMTQLKSKDPFTVKIFSKILELRLKFGSPYIQFIDNCHRQDPWLYKRLGMKTGVSNICLTGDTRVLTNKGLFPIKDLVGKEVTIHDGENWVKNSNFRSYGMGDIIEITLSGGHKIKMTPEHRMWSQKGYYNRSADKYRIKKAKDLEVGEWLKSIEDLEYHGENRLSGSYFKGFLLGDGSCIKNRSGEYRIPVLNLYQPKFECEDALLNSILELEEDQNLHHSTTKDLYFSEKSNLNKYVGVLGDQTRKSLKGITKYRSEILPWVTSFREGLPCEFLSWTKESKYSFICGLLDADGTVSKGNNIQIANINRKLLSDIQNLLSSLGIASSLKKMNRTSDISDKDIFRLNIGHIGSKKIHNSGYLRRLKIDVNKKEPRRQNPNWRKIVDIKYIENKEEVFCTTVPTTESFVLEGNLLSLNCTEIYQYQDKDHTYICTLSSLNADTYDEWKNYEFTDGWTVPFLGTVFLDAVNEDFIQRGAPIEGLENAVRTAVKGRPIGLGLLGLHSYYMSKNVPWESPEAYAYNIEISKYLDEESLKASKFLAQELGEPEWLEGTGIRNIVRLAYAPTTTNSLLCNAGSPGIEPVFSMYYSVAGSKGSFVRKNKYLEKLLEEKGKNNGHVWASIRKNKGSVQHLPFLTPHEKEVFKHAFEINQESIIEQASDRQKYIDQGQSLNLFINSDEDYQKIVNIHLLAYTKNLKSVYYLRSDSVLQNQVGKDEPEFAYIKSRPDCPYCVKAKELMNEKGMKYIEEFKPEGRVPEIWIQGEKLDDGYNSLRKRYLDEEEEELVVQVASDCVSCEG